MCKPVRNRQELRGMPAAISTWEWVPQEKRPCLERSARFLCAHRLCACVLLLVPPSPLPASSKDLFCSSQEIAASRSTRQHFCCWRWNTSELGFFSWMQLIHLLLCDSVLAVVLRSSAKTFHVTPHATGTIFTQRDWEKSLYYNPSALLAAHNLKNL